MIRWSLAFLILAAGIAAPAAAQSGDELNLEGISPDAKAILARMSRSLRRISTYADQGITRMESDSPILSQQPEQPASFEYWKPNRFIARTVMMELACDGRQLTVAMPQLQRYKRIPAEENLAEQLEPYWESNGFPITMARLVLSRRPDQLFAEWISQLELTGSERIDGKPCAVLQGLTSFPIVPGADESPITFWIQEDNAILRRVELDVTAALAESITGNSSGPPAVPERVSYIYDCRNQRINERLAAQELQYQPPENARETDAFYSPWVHTVEGASRLVLSGKPLPKASLRSLDGEVLDYAAWQGQVLVICLIPTHYGEMQATLAPLERVASQFDGKPVKTVIVVDETASPPSKARLRELNPAISVMTDANGEFAEQFDSVHSMSTVLVDAGGVVQGRYTGELSPRLVELLLADVDTLLEGDSLPSARPMSDAEIAEARAQHGSLFRASPHQAPPLNSEWLVQRWSVKADPPSGYDCQASAQRTDRSFWVRRRNSLQHVDANGEITEELKLPKLPAKPFSHETWLVGNVAGRRGVIHAQSMPSPAADSRDNRPGRLNITAFDDQGGEVWRLALDTGAPGDGGLSLCLAELDGQPGDELLFLSDQTLYIVDALGRVTVRWNSNQPIAWAIGEDRDADDRAEIYLRLYDKLLRLDYRPN
jgi:hypothetical protein